MRRHRLCFQGYQQDRDFSYLYSCAEISGKAIYPEHSLHAESTKSQELFSLLAHTVPDYHLNSFFYLAHGDSLPTSRASTKNPQEALFDSCQTRKEPGQKYKLPIRFLLLISAFICPKSTYKYFSYVHYRSSHIIHFNCPLRLLFLMVPKFPSA